VTTKTEENLFLILVIAVLAGVAISWGWWPVAVPLLALALVGVLELAK
jgi:hypothetical protein